MHFATDITMAAWSTTGFNDYALNANGIANINLSGISKFGHRLVSDTDNAAPTWSTGSDTRPHGNFAEGADKPKLVVTYTPASSGLMGKVW